MLLEKVRSLPDKPGIYQYFDENGKLLYIGKAKSLKKRVKSYFRFNPFRPADNLSPRIYKMISEAKDLNYIVVENENDALILENSLIKQLKPKYNILLRDDKTYPYIYIDLDEEFPRLEITRKVVKGKNIKYFGPFSSGASAILKTVYEEIPLVQSKSCLRGKKACLYHQIGKCLAPCEGKITSKEYMKYVDKAIKLVHDKEKILEILYKKMEKYAENLQFEEAAEIRDRIKSIESAEIYSHVDLAKLEDLDIFVVEVFGNKAVVIRIFVREGKVVASSHNIINSQTIPEKSEIYTRAILEFYSTQTPFTSSKILVGDDFEEREWLSKVLSEKFNKKITIITPTTNERKSLVKLAKLNAAEVVKNQKENTILLEIKTLFNLQNVPYKIEVFDTSHMQGEATVGAMVVWEDGKFKKSDYRHYHLEGKDEYSQMRELLTRRAQSFEKNPPPELWLIDGGAAQLKIAKEVIDSTGANVDILAISKEKIDAKAHRAKGAAKDKIYFPWKMEEGELKIEKIDLSEKDKRLQFLQMLRDEAHRFAIEFHRKTKRKKDTQIDLLKIKGIGKAKMTKLLNYFGTFENIKKASFNELKSVLNEKDAKAIIEFFQERK
ncbi:excinuclease ABC subunit C [Caminibacter pacificus]|uniref:UvrABC system protein C n=1 Tax=Caminibacter pacificus TaxID=1424653 RepID=A0AAJ4RDY8_9BACT|nr:excinuclease ABC subunit UvrC [Caminibacter pacificus]ROR40965.1 excinuclease ABC subunit C [Caminibacter pacificus]